MTYSFLLAYIPAKYMSQKSLIKQSGQYSPPSHRLIFYCSVILVTKGVFPLLNLHSQCCGFLSSSERPHFLSQEIPVCDRTPAASGWKEYLMYHRLKIERIIA